VFEKMIEEYLVKLRDCREYDIRSVILFGSVARKMKHGWMIPRQDLRVEINFD